jgi:O-succinylbenzoate synthase
MDGYGCVQPWRQFGHGTADEAWAILAAGGSTELTNQAMECCRLDGAARREGVSWWADLRVPDSHATLTHVIQAGAAHEAGFRIWKVKCGPRDLALLRALIAEYPDVRWRIDCNETADPTTLESWVRDHAAAIDFIEDPYPHSQILDWQRLAANVRLAMDRLWQAGENFLPVWKPAWNGLVASMPKKQTIVTSAMDHPVGQAWAAYQAARIGTEMTCGLRTEHLFESNIFSELLAQWNASWPAMSGIGMGWNDELEGLPWIRIRS